MFKLKSFFGVREKFRFMVRVRSSVDLKFIVLVRVRNVLRFQSFDEVSVRQRDGELSKFELSEDMVVRSRLKFVFRKFISKGSLVLVRQSVQLEIKEESFELFKLVVIFEGENKIIFKRFLSEVEVKVRRKFFEFVFISDLENLGEKVRRLLRYSDRFLSRRSDKLFRRYVVEGFGEDFFSRRYRELSLFSRRYRDFFFLRKYYREF